MKLDSEEAVENTTNKIIKIADKSGTRRIDRMTSIKPLEKEYVNETHVSDFVQALSIDKTPEQMYTQAEKKQWEKSRQRETSKPSGLSYSILRFPFIAIIGSIMFIELVAYFSLRQAVRIWENLFSWRGKKKGYRERLLQAKTYKEWCEAADALDKHMKKDEWKKTVPFAYYDYRLLQKIIKHLKSYRESDNEEDAIKMMDVLYVCLKQNFSGIENEQLYSQSYLGTKSLIEEYVEEVTKSIQYLVKTQFITLKEKKVAFKLYSKNYGRSALCLSGGAGFAYYHLGVIRSLLDRGLLPSIITGTSAGSLIGAIVCTRTNEELNAILNPQLAEHISICNDNWYTLLARIIKTGNLFDVEKWCREAMWFTKGSLTFKEAYDKTGRIFNVSVIPHDHHSPPKLINHITAPDCVIWSAILASAAIPGILPAVVLMQKKGTSKHLTPYIYGKFKDGSLRTDIPTLALNTQFNVNYTIVSQVNPHVHLFFYANQGSPGRPVTHRQGRGWRGGFLASTIEQLLKLDLNKWMKILKQLKLLPIIHDQDWSSVFLQKFDGNVTILPKTGIQDWFHTLSDPDESRLKKLMNSGQLRTWPTISMISNRMRIEATIEIGRKMTKEFQDTSDASSEDESSYLSVRRASMPSTSLDQRQRFLAQFNESKSVREQSVEGPVGIFT